MMKGVRFMIGSSGRKTVVQIDLKKQGRLWEDFHDRSVANERVSEPRESMERVKKRVVGRSRGRRRG